MSKLAVTFKLRLRLKSQPVNLARCKGNKSASPLLFSASAVKKFCQSWNNKDFQNSVGRKAIKSLEFNKFVNTLSLAGVV